MSKPVEPHWLPLLCVLVIGCGACQPFHPTGAPMLPQVAMNSAADKAYPAAGIEVEILAEDSLERSLEVFDCDLPRAGVNPVWVRIRNETADVLQLEGARINVKYPDGRYAAPAAPARVIELLYQSYKIRLYSPHFRAQLESRFAQMSLKLGDVSPGAEASGYLFFTRYDPGEVRLAGARMRWSGLRLAGDSRNLELDHGFPPR